jgi:hypothetical protein
MTSLTIWCDGGTPQADDGPLVLWDAFVPAGSPSTWHSLPDEVHARRDELRAAHLQWIHDIGASRQGVTTLVESLRIRPHLSYWWMTLPADFSLGADSPVYAAVRIMALTGLADRLVATSVRIVASNKDIRNTLVAWASDRGLPATCTTSVKQHDPATRPVAIRARERAYRVAPPLGGTARPCPPPPHRHEAPAQGTSARGRTDRRLPRPPRSSRTRPECLWVQLLGTARSLARRARRPWGSGHLPSSVGGCCIGCRRRSRHRPGEAPACCLARPWARPAACPPDLAGPGVLRPRLCEGCAFRLVDAARRTYGAHEPARCPVEGLSWRPPGPVLRRDGDAELCMDQCVRVGTA